MDDLKADAKARRRVRAAEPSVGSRVGVSASSDRRFERAHRRSNVATVGRRTFPRIPRGRGQWWSPTPSTGVTQPPRLGGCWSSPIGRSRSCPRADEAARRFNPDVRVRIVRDEGGAVRFELTDEADSTDPDRGPPVRIHPARLRRPRRDGRRRRTARPTGPPAAGRPGTERAVNVLTCEGRYGRRIHLPP